ncbi:hypothetical protein K431DRAFT_233160 [Polychaeton citri CBS 116435]|uniref:BAH-domain-containing protein n=1 Tax=Polychaeton citri CBS 116435 TaxID=1314669 RepID=A0A9P4Q2Y3_9PEZI|nr:hypothetical protein K431DRAFT_233160 [Polychaeton citri CBS 116435]
MAQSPSDEVATSSKAASVQPEGKVDSGVTPTAGSATPTSRQSQERLTPSFQAVNSKSFASVGSVAKAAVGGRGQQDDRPTPPPHGTNAPPENAPAAQSSSDGVNAQGTPSQANGGDTAMTEPTYGTRSRGNRTSTRINYAEDQQDIEFESAATTTSYKKKQMADSSASSAAAVAAASPSTNATATGQAPTETKRGFTALNNNNNNNSSLGTTPTAKESATAPSNPKKRKSAGGSASLAHSTQASASASPAPSGAPRKPGNMAVSTGPVRESNLMTFKGHKNRLNKNGELIADDGSKLRVNDHVYLVSEPPGDPYYLCRIMEFLHVDSNPTGPVDSVRVNWYYRPRDVQRFNSDSRLVYATMHSDLCPITALRGRCTIKHRSEIEDLDAYRKERDAFYFVQVFDRFIRRWYECIPTSQIINVPEKVKKALDERWKFVAVEVGRVKELTSAVKTCKRCARFCASHDSVDCAICKNSYHMNCVQPPLPKKPSRGFAWACGPCGRASERKMEARNTPNPSAANTDVEDEEIVEEEAEEPSNESTRAPSPDSDIVIDDHPATLAEIRLAQMWPMRYLGIHCRVEDALQYDDRAIYPRASSRLGPRHQANTQVWHGRSVELVKPIEIKKKYVNSKSKKEGKLSKETLAALEADRVEKSKRPKWVQDAPPGYVERGEDYPDNDPRTTAKRMFIMPDDNAPAVLRSGRGKEQFLEEYVSRAKLLAKTVGVPPFGINFIDKALELLTECDYNVETALKKLSKVDRRKDLHEPVLSKDQLSKFEEGVAKYGSEHRLIRLHMKTTLPNSDIVRFYYLWKKTPKGREIWGNYGGRKSTKRKLESDAGARLQAEVAHDADDSAFDNDKATKHKRSFQCKFCSTRHSRQWRRAPGVSPGQTILTESKSGNKDKKERVLLALCLRCCHLWRKYAIQWEDIDEITKKAAQSGGRSTKRKIDEELLRELMIANETANPPSPEPVAVASIEAPVEPPKKKSKTEASHQAEAPKKKEKPPPPPKQPTPPPPPIIPAQPTMRILPCAVCSTIGNTIECEHCKLTVHRRCFGLGEKEGVRPSGETHWVCEQCQNDRNPQVSTEYSCALCLTEETVIDLVEPPKAYHKKKNEREKEKERLEKELVEEMRMEYYTKQWSVNRPILPREPLKRTAGNNWVHVYCALFTPEVRFSNAKKLEVAEGIQTIPHARHEAICKLCKNRDQSNKQRNDKGACVACLQCGGSFHVSCAIAAGYQFGFDVTPVKGSRKDSVTTITLGQETGAVLAGIWCKEHTVKTTIHPLTEVVDESGKTALQHYVESYKQADLTWTGTARKANLAQSTKERGQQSVMQAAPHSIRRESTTNSIAAAVKRGARNSVSTETKADELDGGKESPDSDVQGARRCAKCKIDVTPRWHPLDKSEATNDSSTQTRPSTETNGDARPSIEQGIKPENADGHGSQALALGATPADGNRGYLCHKCFIKKELDPTPPPPEPPTRREISPPKQLPPQMGWAQSVPPPQPHAGYEAHPRPHHWEEAHRHSQQPPPTNGFPPPSAHPAYSHPVHGPYNAGYRPPPPYPPAGYAPPQHAAPQGPPPQQHHGSVWQPQPPPPPPPMHERHGSFHHPHPGQPSPNPPPSAPHHAPPSSMAPHTTYRPPTLSGPASAPPLANGIASPHGTPQYHQPLQSPTHAPPPHPPYVSFAGAPHRTQSPFSTQLPPISQPLHSGASGSHPEQSHSGQPQAHSQVQMQAQQSGVKQGTPQPAVLQSDSRAGRSGTPHDAQNAGTPGPTATQATSGASASPNLRNLLH